MASHTIILNLPETVYEQIQQAAETSRRPVNDVLVEAIAAVAPVVNTASDHLRAALAHMAYLNDAALWQAARTTMPPEQRSRLATLHDKQQYTSLTPEERAEEQALLRLYHATLLVRAQAAVLLKQRGYDVCDPEQSTPLV